VCFLLNVKQVFLLVILEPAPAATATTGLKTAAMTSAAHSKVHENIATSAKRKQLKQVTQPRNQKVGKQSK
jgi:hypothetical protein